MHLVFISSLLTLSHTGSYPSSPAPWPSSTNYIPKSNETYNPIGCSRVEVVRMIDGIFSLFRRGILKSTEQKQEQSFFISPLAFSLAISMLTSRPVKKETPTSGTKLSREECFQLMSMQPLIDYLADYKSTGLSLASGVFVSPKVELGPEFIETVTKTFRAPLRSVDFEKPIEMNNFISEWGANHVTSLVNADTSLALANVVCFEGEWALKFNVNNTIVETSEDDSGKTIQTSFMRMTANLRHGRHSKGNASFYELPFKSGDDARNMSMFVIIPDRIDEGETWKVIDRIQEFDITDLISNGTYGSIPIFLSKFKIESIIDIEPAAQQTLGERGIFDRETTKLRGITESPNLFGDKFVQRIVVEVDEDGCRAVTSDTLSDPTPRDISKYAFAYYALIGTTGDNPQVIFAGRYLS